MSRMPKSCSSSEASYQLLAPSSVKSLSYRIKWKTNIIRKNIIKEDVTYSLNIPPPNTSKTDVLHWIEVKKMVISYDGRYNFVYTGFITGFVN